MNKKWVITITVVLYWATWVSAIIGVGRAFDLVTQGGIGFTTFVGSMFAANEWRKTKELAKETEIRKAELAQSVPVQNT